MNVAPLAAAPYGIVEFGQVFMSYWDSFWSIDRTRIRANRSLTSYDKVQRMIGVFARNRRALNSLPPKGAYFDLGCGENVKPGFWGCDYHWLPGVPMCWDATKGLPFADNWLAGVFTEHMMEHVPIEAGYCLVAELFRVIQPAGVVRIVVPSLEIYARKYVEAISGGLDDMPTRPTVNGDYTPAISVNEIFNDWGHRFIYDFDTLKLMLGKAGFVDIRRRAYLEGSDPKLLIDTDFRASESLYVEARKP